MIPLADQVAVVTGAGSGIGKALALALGAQGADLALVGRHGGPLDAVAQEARAAGAEARTYPTDLTRPHEIRDLGAALERDFGRVDVVIHSAAVAMLGAVADAAAEDFDTHYRTNLLGPYLLSQCLLPMLRKRRGQIVFINSSAGLIARANVGQYAATKHALKAIADSLREEVNCDGVRVLSVFAGRTATPMQQRLLASEGRPFLPDRLLQPEDIASAVINSLCLAPTAEVTEIKIRPMMKFE
jgi:NAD(P)-dependent dehydrogenase (short-subunit alcohol dehydrogenase family)